MKTIKLSTLSKSILVAGMLSMIALPAAANSHYKNDRNDRSYHKTNNHKSVSFAYAKVVNVEPVFKTYQVNKPVEYCYEQQVPTNQRSHNNRNRSYKNEIIGGVIGAAIGNRVGRHGRGKARDITTVLGAVLGATVANDLKHNHRRNRSSNGYYEKTRYETVEHCEIQDSYSTERKLIGYDVAYKYNGHVYHTQSNEHPGKRIRVQLVVNPA